MELLLLSWPFELLGRFHPLLVHFPIGLLIGTFLLEGWTRFRRKESHMAGMVYLGALTAVMAAVMGGLLLASGTYTGELINVHQFTGYLTAGLATITAGLYFQRSKIASWIPFSSLGLSCLVLAIAGHFGASITHGADYLSAVLPTNKIPARDAGLMESLSAFAEGDEIPLDQLDRLNLEVRAIFAHNCYQCHSSEKQKGDLALDTKKGVFAGGESGPILEAGNAEHSELIRRLTIDRSDEDAMPPKGKSLSREEIELIRLWIDRGAHWADKSLKVFREAELALHKPPLPEAPASIVHPVDRFVNHYFAEQGVKWPELIDDRTFIRRAYLDITGLLPSPAAVKGFIADQSSEKRAHLIAALLSDKQNYALHWLSFWNDLLRNDYSGPGYITGGRKQITDWLYTALIEEKPYNKMVAELVNPGPDSEGFIKGIQWRGEINASQRTELQAAQNVSQSLLGLNLKCASCHNSFVNNLTLDQAYGFASIFAEAPLQIYRCDKPTERMAQAAFLFPQLGEVNGDSLKERLAQLAAVMVQPDNGRLYRTIVNRFWDKLLGRGIVAPVDEMDNIPWSQDLLDWLASDFIEKGYDFRQLLTQIMTSRAYQLPAVAYPSPTYLLSNTFVFKGPALRRLTAEQMVDAFSQTITPLYQSVAYDPESRSMEAEWIWHPQEEVDRKVLPYPGTRLFRKTFSLERGKQLVAAQALITADHSFQLSLNGKIISAGKDWREVQKLDFPIDLFSTENLIAVKGTNDGLIPNPAGLLFQLRLQYADSTQQLISSDRSWKSTADTLAQNWTTLAYDDREWTAVERQGRFQKSYWGALLRFRFESDTIHPAFARAGLVQQDDFMKTLARPTRENVATQRDQEATLLQALMLTNSKFFHENIARGARQWLEKSGDEPGALVEALYWKALGRSPTRKERKRLLQELEGLPDPRGLEDIIWALVLLPEFQFI
ncbi:MAG: DUF1553 domain-containing protein [Saprospiraceae bacterium]